MSSSLLLAADGRETQSRADRDLQAELIFEWPPKRIPEWLRQQRGCSLKPLILIAGATGYVGGELLKSLLAAGYPVRCLARRPDVLQSQETLRTRGCRRRCSRWPICAGRNDWS